VAGGTERTLFFSVQLPFLRFSRWASLEEAAYAIADCVRKQAETLNGDERWEWERNKSFATPEGAQITIRMEDAFNID
jgi:hypothetical protein